MNSIQNFLSVTILSVLLLLLVNVNTITFLFCDSFSIPSIPPLTVRHTTTTAGIRMVQPSIYSNNNIDNDDSNVHTVSVVDTSRRSVMTTTAAKFMTVVVAGSSLASIITAKPLPAVASGGATAGRYTTIPIAKRRYYGRVQQAVHEFLTLGPLIVKGDVTNPVLPTFFDVNGIVVVAAKRKDVNGQCTKKDNECKGLEIRDSRYNDMKVSMYLLGNAFRTDQQKPPDRLPTVKAARAFFKEMNAMEKLVQSKKRDSVAIQKLYVNALTILDIYLDLVELPPTDSGHYDKEFDTLVGETARIT